MREVEASTTRKMLSEFSYREVRGVLPIEWILNSIYTPKRWKRWYHLDLAWTVNISKEHGSFWGPDKRHGCLTVWPQPCSFTPKIFSSGRPNADFSHRRKFWRPCRPILTRLKRRKSDSHTEPIVLTPDWQKNPRTTCDNALPPL